MALKCAKCAILAPDNVSVFPSKTGTLWFCSNCDQVHLLDQLTELYKSGKSGRYLYVSDLTNNLDKVNQHFAEKIELDNPTCVIVLVVPEGLAQVQGVFNGVYLDRDCATQGQLSHVLVTPEAFVRVVNGTSQCLV